MLKSAIYVTQILYRATHEPINKESAWKYALEYLAALQFESLWLNIAVT